VVIGADVRTADPRQPRATAFAVRDGRFVAVGDDDAIRRLAGAGTEVLHAAGATITPGFLDSHVHLAGGVSLIRGVDLYGMRDRKAWLDRIAERSRQLPPGEWLLGGRWDHTIAGGALPTRQELDAVVPDRPVFLLDVDAHAAWVNSRALALAGIGPGTAAPADGVIVKDPETGEPTGILLEGAKDLVRSSAAFREGTHLEDDERLAALGETLAYAASLGITAAHEIGSVDTFRDYRALRDAGRLRLRIWYGFLSDTGDRAEIARFEDARAGLGSSGRAPARGPLLEAGFVKLYVDGVLSTRTAALLAPYADHPHESGLPMIDAASLSARVAAANAANFPVAIHAIGDRGVRMALDAFAASPARPRLPNRVEHIELLHPGDLKRFRGEGVIASMQAHHAVTTFYNYLEERVGDGRAGFAYAWKSIADSGASLLLGSDWPTAPLAPLDQLWAAIFRESALWPERGTFREGQRLGFDEALHAYTQAAADAAGWGGELGSITAGKWADFVILDRRLADPVARDLREVRPKATYLAGQRIHPAP